MSSLSRGHVGKAVKPNKVVKPKKNTKHTTQTSRNHRFQSFNQRISNLKIDPIRRKRYVDAEEVAIEGSKTYLGHALEEWRDMNLSQTFTAFAKEAAPLCENLPGVLYNQDKIMNLLVRYIEKSDALAMEPLFSLLSHFAHDLDTRFERHFQRAVAAVVSVAAIHADFAVIEWSFNCLAWLFKYLSRLLTPDLRSLYGLMAPYLGKGTRKPFIIRFTAEALSFLIRKAAVVYERDQTPLDLVIEHILRDCTATMATASTDLHQQGIMTLLTEAVKGVQNGVNTGGISILQSILKFANELAVEGDTALASTVSGILTSLIHHCTVDTFKPILDVILTFAQNARDSAITLPFCSNILFTAISVRKGTRISDWKRTMDVIKGSILACSELQNFNETTASSVLSLLAIAMQTATIDAVLTTNHILETLRTGKWRPYFLRFCDVFARLGLERFHHFILPHFQRFVLDLAADGDEGLYSLIPRLANGKQDLKLNCDSRMIDSALDRLANFTDPVANENPKSLAQIHLWLEALQFLVVNDRQLTRLKELLVGIISRSLKDGNETSRIGKDFALGTVLRHLLAIQGGPVDIPGLWELLCEMSTDFISLPAFWSNILQYIKTNKPAALRGLHIDRLESSLVSCLAMPSHTIRQDALAILQVLYRLRGISGPDVLATAARIESLPISLETSRSISMNIRRLAPEYSQASNDSFITRAIPTYCFGLLHLNLSQAWDDATNALAAISRFTIGEEVMMNLAQAWLEGKIELAALDDEAPPVLDIDSNGFKVLSDFECPNLAKISAITRQVFSDFLSGFPTPQRKLVADHRRIPRIGSATRSQAIKVLAKVPQIAEKRSRFLVPVLLRWAGTDADDKFDGQQDVDRWTRKDQKAMLSLFAQFINPKVLYRSEDVYNALLALCSNGDVEIQRSALKAVLSWKEPAVFRYEEHLNNLLDEARFREEVSVFLRDNADGEEDAIRPEDHNRLMPVLLRLLYGRAVAGGKDGQAGRRKAIFVALSRFGPETLKTFLEIALAASRGSETYHPKALRPPNTSPRQQFGMLNMVNDMLQVLGADLSPFADELLNGILACTMTAARRLEGFDEKPDSDSSVLRSIRQTGMQCLVSAFSLMTDFDSQTYGKIALAKLIEPRLSAFVSENAQSVSGTLRLLAAWASSPMTIQLFEGSGGKVLGYVADLIPAQYTKDEVRLYILEEVLQKITSHPTANYVLQSHVSAFLHAIGALIQQQPSKLVLDASVKSFSHLAEYVTSGTEAADITKICTELLTKPGKMVSPDTKIGLLQTVRPLIEKFEILETAHLHAALCALFSRLKEPEGRVLLSEVLAVLLRNDFALSDVAQRCIDMNALGARLDEPDYDRRERAFAWIYESSMKLTLQQWLPIVHNCLYYIRDDEDRVSRSSASHALQLFVDSAAEIIDHPRWRALLDEAVLDGIQRGMREPSELVRSEYLGVLGRVVERLPNWPKVNDMQTLVMGGDEEASFFANILHIQQHRRLRALRRLADGAPSLGSGNASRIFLPLLEHFVFDQVEGDAGRTLADQSVQTVAALAKVLNPPAFRATFQRYAGYLKSKSELEKTILRLLGALVDGLENVPQNDRSRKSITEEHLPPLLEYLHQKDESTVDRRMPVAVTIVKLLLLLPIEDFTARLPAVLTDVSHVLRSRSQEARDETRKALKSIAALVHRQYFGFILKELRSALKRGYQLHVLSFTVHSLLVESNFGLGDLDECVSDLMLVILDDIFGVTGQEKDAEEYKSGMKEVKSSKSFDTMELLARITPIHRLGDLVRPIRSLLSEKLDMKMVKKIDDLLARLRKGLDQNPASDSRDMLSFCWEIVNQVYAEESALATTTTAVDERRRRYLVQSEAPKGIRAKGTTSSYQFKLISFALNLLRKVLKRHEDLATPQNITGFLPMAGDALIQGQEEVKLSAVRFLATVMRVPMPQLDENVPVYIKETVIMIHSAADMTTDSARAALELVTAILRDKRSVSIKEKEIALVLKRIKPDVDEPDRQGVIYKFIRAVLGRKIVITEVYEVLDEIGNAMITNPDRQVRESARGAYLHFVMEYPQGKDRWQKQTSFLVGNLQYEHASGRQSVMEFLHQMLGKIGEDVLAETSPRIFVSLLPVIVSDTDRSCQEMARLLVSRLFERAAAEQTKQFLSLLETWLKREKKSSIKAGALQCWTVLLRAKQLPPKQLESFRNKLEEVVSDCVDNDAIVEPQLALDALQAFAILIETAPAIGLARKSAQLWQAVQRLPASEDTQLQEAVANLLGAYFTDVASTSSKTADGLSGLPLQGSGGLDLGSEDMRRLCLVNLRALRAISLSTAGSLVTSITRNIVFLGRCFAANEMPWNEEPDEASDNDDPEEVDTELSTDKSALANLIRRLSSMIMADKFSIVARTAALQCETTLFNQLSVIPKLQSVLRPLYALTDPSVPKPPGDLHKALEDKAHETLELVQKKIGSAAYVAALATTRAEAKARRDERRQKRRIETVSAPEKWAQEKKRKYEVKKEKQKAKGVEARGRRRGW